MASVNKVMNVAAASIGKIIGVSAVNISKVTRQDLGTWTRCFVGSAPYRTVSGTDSDYSFVSNWYYHTSGTRGPNISAHPTDDWEVGKQVKGFKIAYTTKRATGSFIVYDSDNQPVCNVPHTSFSDGPAIAVVGDLVWPSASGLRKADMLDCSPCDHITSLDFFA